MRCSFTLYVIALCSPVAKIGITAFNIFFNNTLLCSVLLNFFYVFLLESEMASVYADPKLRNKRSYIAAEAFDGSFFDYVVTKNINTNVTTGTLVAVPGANASNCPQGRILREVGKRLYPDAHPGITTMMVKVYDANSGLSGYIDPNAPVFAVFNSDKPVEIVDGGDNNGATPHKGQPVFTTGDIITSGGDITAQTGDITATAGDITAGGDITTTGGSLILAQGSTGLFKLPTTLIGSANMAAGTDDGTYRRLVVSTTGVLTTSKIFFTYSGLNNPGFLSAESRINGTSFQIVSTNRNDAGVVQWMIVNNA